MQAAEIFVHPDLNRRAGNDYCLVKLTKPLVLDGCRAKKIKLASKRDDRLYGQRCFSAGWGTVQVNEPRSAVLRKITTRTDCKNFSIPKLNLIVKPQLLQINFQFWNISELSSKLFKKIGGIYFNAIFFYQNI